MSYYKPSGGEIAESLLDDIAKIRAEQYKIGSVASEFMEDKEFVEEIANDYEYILKCVAQYEATKDIILIPYD